MSLVFSHSMRSGILKEYCENGEFFFKYENGNLDRRLSLYTILCECEDKITPYLGYTPDEILKSGSDVLGEKLIKNGDPSYREVKSALPPITKGCYIVLGGVVSSSGLTVDDSGNVYNQLSGRDADPLPVFSPCEYDASLGSVKPRQYLVDKRLPIIVSVHTDGISTLEFLYFVEPTEPDRDPICWIRAKKYNNSEPENTSIEYRVAAISREADGKTHFNTPPSEKLYLDALSDTVSFWVDYSETGAKFDIPEKELSRVALASMAFSAITCTCARTHYGHRFYGKELHDNFPPNYIWRIQSLICLGRYDEARETFLYFMNYVLRSDGRINYRQGLALEFGASAAEYGMLLDVIARYRSILNVNGLNLTQYKKLVGMGEEILEHVSECEELDGLRMVKMCAEADTNERIHVYLNNNVWAIRGLEALGSMIEPVNGKRYAEEAAALRKSLNNALMRYAVKDTVFGDLPPFRLGYTATPLTLSKCEDTFYPIDNDKRLRYFSARWSRDDTADGEELIENTYANYRYYPEMLSAMLLPNDMADAVVKMRQTLGGELMCMTRFMGHVDNWPVLNYARYLIETDKIEKYLLLLYAHTAHHGDPDTMTYYEQINIYGESAANDCLPSLLTAPIMLSWCFAYEPMDGTVLRLLSAVPKEWFKCGFSAEKLGFSNGSIDVSYENSTLKIKFDRPIEKSVEVVLRSKNALGYENISLGSEYVAKIKKNVLILKPGITEACIGFDFD